MSQRLEVHPTHPQPRLLRMAAGILHGGGLLIYPTDTSYALACHMGDKQALERIVMLRRLPRNHQFTLTCRDLSELGTYARVDNPGYRVLKRYTPGPFTFVMRATREVPKRLVHAKRRTIGIRVPDHPVALALLEAMGEPLMTTSLRLPDDEQALCEPEEIWQKLGKQVDVFLDTGMGQDAVSTVLDLTHSTPEVLRKGIGELD